jgi:hypothetical protein
VSEAGDERRYIRAVEAAWSKLLGRAAVVSPREFAAIDAWRRRGIPLSVVLEVIAGAAKRRSLKAPRSLTALSDAIESAWATVASGRAATGAPDRGPQRDDALRAYERAAARLPDASPLHVALSRWLDDARRGGDDGAADAALDALLPGAVSGELLERATRNTRRDLEGFRSRMSAEEFKTLLARAIVDALRAEFALPRLSLTRDDPSRRPPRPRLQ